jgi:GGDEF domain-containing protein
VALRPIIVYYRREHMNRRFVAAFAAACVTAALASAAFVAYRVLDADASGRKSAKADFEGLRSVLANVKGASDLAEPSLRARLASRYEANPSLLLVDVYERGDGDRWRIPAESSYLPAASTGSVPEPLYPPASTILLSAPLKGDSSGKLAVDALYTSLPQSAVFSAFRDALIGLAAFLALAALVLAFVSSFGYAGSPASAATYKPADEGLELDSSAASASELAAAAAEYQYDTLGSSEGEAEAEREFDLEPEIMPELEPGYEFDAKNDAGHARGISIKAPAAPLEEEFDIPIIAEDMAAADTRVEKDCGDRPEGLYSPSSGLGWESYMEERLDAEISRSASFEQDLSILFFSYDGLSSHDKNYSALGACIEKFFSFRDLAFERGDDGFSVILPNIDSVHALRMAEEFYKKLVFLAAGDFAELELLPIFMGISSRGGRLVDAGRMMIEADTALDKARYEKDTRIVAFRPDPDKYRLFLASKGA